MKHYILGENGIPKECTLMEWGAAFGSNHKVVAKAATAHFEVSTVFLGLDHNFSGKGPPILWETMVFGTGPLDGAMDRCSGTKEQAEAMHQRMVLRVLKEEEKIKLKQKVKTKGQK